MDIIIVALISTAGMFGAILLLDHSFFRRLKWKQEYEKDMIKLKNAELRKNKKLGSKIKTSAPKGKIESLKDWIHILKDMDPDNIRGLLKLIPDTALEDFEKGDDLVSVIATYAEENPNVVKAFIDGISSKDIESGSQNY